MAPDFSDSPLPPPFRFTPHLYDHLGNTLAAKRLAALESLALDTGQEVEEGGNEQDDSCGDQT